MTDWHFSNIKQPPRNGKPFWAWLHNSGIRKMRWETAGEFVDRTGRTEKPKEFAGAYVEADNPDEDWRPDYWLPFDAIKEPPQ